MSKTIIAITRTRTRNGQPYADPVVPTEPADAPDADITTADGPSLSREDQIRASAFALYEARGCSGGHALEDWLQAETQFDTQAAQLADF